MKSGSQREADDRRFGVVDTGSGEYQSGGQGASDPHDRKAAPALPVADGKEVGESAARGSEQGHCDVREGSPVSSRNQVHLAYIGQVEKEPGVEDVGREARDAIAERQKPDAGAAQ